MSEVIYRKYRARTFAEIQAQTIPVSILTQAFRTNQFAHAYLFTGPRGTGKTSMARLVAKAANCVNFAKLGDVCNECESCKAIDAGTFLDLYEIDAASNRGIDEIRQLKESINFLPVQGKRKVYIIDEVHMLTREAFNALLKTLEEPPEHVIFILATTEPHKIPVTILSRVQRFDFRLAQPEELAVKLRLIIEAEGFTAEDDIYELIYTHSEGSFRDAESLLGKVMSNTQDQKSISSELIRQVLGMASVDLVTNLITSLLSGDTETAFTTIDSAQAQAVDLVRLIQQLATQLRNDIVHNLANTADYQAKLGLLSAVLALQVELKQIDDPRLLIDVFVLKQAKPNSAKQSDVPPQEPTDAGDDSDAPTSQPLSKKTVKPAKTSPKLETKSGTQPAQAELTAQWSQLVAKVRKYSFKYWTMIKICNPQFADNVLTINSIYPTNLQNLQAEDILQMLHSAVSEIWGEQVQLQFAQTAKPDIVHAVELAASNIASGFDSNAELIEAIL